MSKKKNKINKILTVGLVAFLCLMMILNTIMMF